MPMMPALGLIETLHSGSTYHNARSPSVGVDPLSSLGLGRAFAAFRSWRTLFALGATGAPITFRSGVAFGTFATRRPSWTRATLGASRPALAFGAGRSGIAFGAL